MSDYSEAIEETKATIQEWLDMPQNPIGIRAHPVTVECPVCMQFVGSSLRAKVGHLPHCVNKIAKTLQIDEEGKIL